MINPEPSIGTNTPPDGAKAILEAFEALERSFIENTVRFEIMKAVIGINSDMDLPKRKELYALVSEFHTTYQRWAKQMREIRKLP